MIRVLVLLAVLAAPALAHDLRPGVLAFVESEPGELRVRFLPPIDSRGEAIDLALVLPDGCTRKDDRVHCTRGFGGELAVGGMRGHAMKIYVSLERDGKRRDWVLTSEAPRLDLGPSPPVTVHDKIRAGVHAFGDVHVALALAFVFAFGVTAQLGWALLAFTLARVLAAQLHLDGPFEACVALAVVLLARGKQPPHAIAAGALFGIASGLALPGAPWFQVGVALTAAVIVALAAAVAVGTRRLVGERRVVRVRAHRAACHALGALAVYWLLARVV